MTQAVERKFANLVIRASAGTGKTFQLSNRYIALACAGELPEQILAVTFARKAAGEILGRVLLRLAEAALDPRKASALAKEVDEPALDQARATRELRQLIQRLHRLRIGTLDSFFVQMATHFSLELGFTPGWTIVDEIGDQELRADAIQAVLDGKDTGDIVALLQLLSKGDVTRSVTSQIWDAVGSLYTLYRETPRDAWHALKRPKELSVDEVEGARQMLAAVPLPQHKSWANRRNADVQYVATGDWLALIRGGIAGQILCGIDTYYGKTIEPEVRAAYEPLIGQARAVIVKQLANQTESTWKLLDDFHAEYEQLKLRAGQWRFDDVSRKLADSLNDGKLDRPGYRLDSPLAHLLLDEFQDTSLAQWEVVRPFAKEVTLGGHGSFFCVGDVKQAIYGWRGGLSEIFDTVVAHLEGLEHKSLKESYRSCQAVIDTVNRVFQKIADNPALEDTKAPARYAAVRQSWKERYEEHSTARNDLDGHCRLVLAPRSETQGDATLEFAAHEIRRLVRRHPGRTVGVLVRTNASVAQLIYHLRNDAVQPILASEEGGNPLTDSAAVQLVLSLLKIADHPGDTVARFHVAESPLAKVVKLVDHGDHAAARRLAAQVRHQLGVDGYGRTIDGWVKELAPHANARELNRLLQFVEMAYKYDAAATTRTTDFIRHVEGTKVEDPTSALVRVMTVHQAKGLQFDMVVLPELDKLLRGQVRPVAVDRDEAGGPVTLVCRYAGEDVQPMLPKKFQQMFDKSPDQAVNESLCLLYVAMTRAVHALHMIVAPPAENARSVAKSFAGVLLAALADKSRAIEPGAIVYEHGDETWSDSKSVEHDAAPSVELLKVKLRKESSTPRRALTRQTPSSLQGGDKVDLARRMQLDNTRALGRGSLFHKWFECLAWLDDGEPTDNELLEAVRGTPSAECDLPNELKEYRAILQRPQVREVLSRAAYMKGRRDIRLEGNREQPFILQEGEKLIRGAIDRLVLVYQGEKLVEAEVLDYKTDQLSGGKIAEAVEHYRPQMDAYRRAAAQYTGLDMKRVTAKLVFVVPGVVESV